MCVGGGLKKSAPAIQKAPVAPVIVAPIEANGDSKRASDQERKRRQAATGRSDTILTGSMGDTSDAKTGTKQLLGQ